MARRTRGSAVASGRGRRRRARERTQGRRRKNSGRRVRARSADRPADRCRWSTGRVRSVYEFARPLDSYPAVQTSYERAVSEGPALEASLRSMRRARASAGPA